MSRRAPDLIDARDAMSALGIKAQTLYAYVSRGLIRSFKPEKRKANLYYREDVEALQMRGRTRKATENAAQRALRVGGGAVMHTAITELTEQGPRYRGLLATDLATAGRTYEQCVELLWSGLLPYGAPAWDPLPENAGMGAFVRAIRPTLPTNTSRRVLAVAVEAWASCSGPQPEISTGVPILAARQVVHVMVGAIGLLSSKPRFNHPRSGESLARALARSLGIDERAEHIRALDAALVLCADHELAPSTFAARIAASAGADIYSCISSALGAFEGLRTGLGCDLAEQLLREATSPKRYVAALASIAKRKEPLPGYNHALYPEGDPRAKLLLEIVRSVSERSSPGRLAVDCIAAATEEFGAQVGHTVGLGALAIALGQNSGTSGALMALGRSGGWAAHVYEQRTAGFLVRPRAKYVGLGSSPD
jgi:citrate synthase